ncbi:MAG TPA: NACHT domain-containing protein [Mycobacteriales bacterium]|nr:NACHT domain-containing protein [Mycobacteriales bacterium]
MGGVPEPSGLDLWRVVQVITTRGVGAGRRGSGYRMAGNVVLTAAHVVCDAMSVQVRFLTEDGGTRESYGEPVWAHAALDIALLKIADDSSSGGLGTVEVLPVRFARILRPVGCEALGFPRFKLRPDTALPDRGTPMWYRDSHHARGDTTPASDWLTGSLEITVRPPEYDAEPDRSPWEGMSGAAVLSGGCVIGVISEHHRPDGLGKLTASRVDRWYKRLTPTQISELNDLIGLPTNAGQLEQLPRSSPLPQGAPGLHEEAKELAFMVKEQWQREEERRRVHDPFPLPVRFQPAGTGLVDHWASIRQAPRGTDPGPLPLAGQLDRIVKVYRSIPSHRLVVLGAAGSGKTILTLRFVLDWLSDRAPGDPIPVIFGLGSWDPTTISLRDWMCGQLVRDYVGFAAPAAHGGNLAGALVDAGWILPVLDGFDEIASGLQGAALTELNNPKMPLLLTSRPAEYTEAVRKTKVLTAAAVVELDNLTLDDLADYLPLASSPGPGGGLRSTVWEPVLTGLRKQPRSPGAANVATVLTTPLMVAMARSVYSDVPGQHPAELLDTTRFATPEALQKHLLAEFIPAAYHRPLAAGGTGRRRQRHWNPEDAQHWLGYLAAHLDQLGTRDLAWWQLGTTMRRSSRMLMVGFLAALAFGVTTGVGNFPVDLIATSHGLTFALVRGLVVGLLHGLVAGLAFGLAYGFISRAGAEPSRVRIQIFGRTREARARFAPRFMVGLGFGLSAALVLVLVDRLVVESLGLGDGLDGGLVGALVFVPEIGLGAGLVLGLMGWLEVPIDIRSAVRPADLLNTNRMNVVFYLLVLALVFGLLAGLVNGLMAGPVFGLLAGLVFGLIAAFGGGLGYGLSLTAWGQWVALSRIWLPLTGRLPWALIAFLDDACKRGVLRQAGAVYQFRHARLQDHLTHVFQARRDQQPVGSR